MLFSDNFYDTYPCDSIKRKEQAWQECRWMMYGTAVELTPDNKVSAKNCR